ncbi:HAD-IC family P-type ATPase [Mycolicibacterium thermoresistibile]
MGILQASLRGVQLAAGTALLVGDSAAGAGRALADTAAGVVGGAAATTGTVARAAAGVVAEAVGGPPARRTSRSGTRHWIEVRGLTGPDADVVAEKVLAAVRAVPGVTDAVVNRSMARVVVSAESAELTTDLRRVIGDAERQCGVGATRHRPLTLPWDDEVLVARSIGAAAAYVGLTLSITGRALRVPGLPDLLSVAPTMADHIPRVRRAVERRLGREGADLLFSTMSSASAALTVSPTTAAAELATRSMLAVEAWNTRAAWRRHEPRLASRPATTGSPQRGTLEFGPGAGERYADRIGWVGVTAAALVGAITRNPTVSGGAALVTAPKPSRATREAFGCAMTRGLTTRHDALVVRTRALRALDRLDAVVIDPRVLYTDSLAVTRITGVTNSARTRAWQAVQAALDDGGLTSGWHPLSEIAGTDGEALISPVRDPFAAALVAEARHTSARVVSVDDDGLRSLAQGFDYLHPLDGSVDDALSAVIGKLRADGRTVALLTTATSSVTADANVTIGIAGDGEAPPWGADVYVPDLVSAWRVLHAVPAARKAAAKGIQLAASSTAIGALMLIPGVVGRGPESVNAGVVAGLWSGFRSAAKVFDDPPPEPDPMYEWFAMPADEVQRRLPRPPDEEREDHNGDAAQLVPLRWAQRGAAWSWELAHDFADEMRANLADPITPLLATGAVASALLGSPFDAALVGGVLIANAALSSQQQLHAERVMRRLLASEEPLARRQIGPAGEDRWQKVRANRLRLGDVIKLNTGDVVPADARLIDAANVEADESSLTGESLPVTKSTEPTPGAPLAERACMLYAGSTVVAGTAVAVVTAVGSRTEVRRALAMAPQGAKEIGLHRQLSRLTKRALPFSVSSGALVGLLSVARGTPIRAAVGSAVSLIVAAVPEGLPLVATLAQLAAARRLSGESVLIRNAHSIEALARLDVVCFDKTGTLSQNRLRVKSVRPLGRNTEEQILDAAWSTTFSRPGKRAHHATDDAVRRAVFGKDKDGRRAEVPRDGFLPFQAGRPFAAAIRGTRLTIKGAPEVLASALSRTNGTLQNRVEAMAAEGLRVLAVASRELTSEQVAAALADPEMFEELCRSDLTPMGLLGLADTPRDSAPEVLAELAERGIGVRLITGDHPVTAAVVANELGLQVSQDQVLTGGEWEQLSVEEQAEAVRTRLVFARMTPEHKIDVVRTLERSGLVTAMVGDGANDAAAIRSASVGVGVAARGSDPARTAADMVLLDGRIEALIDALDEGQQLWRRVQSAVSMLLGGNAGEIAFALITSLLTGRSVLNARQMLLVNMLTDALPAAALAVSTQTHTGAADLDEAAMWRAIGIRGAATTVGAGLAWGMASVTGTQNRASTVALIGLVSTQLAQTLTDSRGRLVVATALGSYAVLAGIISTPGLSQIFGCTPVGPVGWGQALLATGVAAGTAAVAPELLQRVADMARRQIGASLLVDDDDADEGVRTDAPDPSSVS